MIIRRKNKTELLDVNLQQYCVWRITKKVMFKNTINSQVASKRKALSERIHNYNHQNCRCRHECHLSQFIQETPGYATNLQVYCIGHKISQTTVHLDLFPKKINILAPHFP